MKKPSEQENIVKKIQTLNTDTIYNVSLLSKGIPKRRVYISRLADKGEIIKIHRGSFYKPSNKTLYRKSDKTVPLNKEAFSVDLFWSVKDGFMIDSDTLIKTYLKNFNEYDLMALYSMFGYKRLLKSAWDIYKDRKNKDYIFIRKQLEKFDLWRLERDK